jgi:hypothetical protein
MRLWHSSRSASVVVPLRYSLRNPSKCNMTKSRTQPMQYTTFSLVNNLFLHEYLFGEPAYVIRHLARRVQDASTRRSSSYTCSRWLISFIPFFAITRVYYYVLIRYLKRLQTQSHLSARARLPILRILQLVRIAQSFPFANRDIKSTDRWSATKPKTNQKNNNWYTENKG